MTHLVRSLSIDGLAHFTNLGTAHPERNPQIEALDIKPWVWLAVDLAVEPVGSIYVPTERVFVSNRNGNNSRSRASVPSLRPMYT